jgi:hypothetical protein
LLFLIVGTRTPSRQRRTQSGQRACEREGQSPSSPFRRAKSRVITSVVTLFFCVKISIGLEPLSAKLNIIGCSRSE